MQHNCLLPLTDPVEQHNLPVGELERVVMHVRLVLLDLPEHTATFGSPTAAKPPVIELLNFVDTSLSPTFAGRDATYCRL